MTLESVYQNNLINHIRRRLPNCMIVKNDSSYRQGIPDLAIFNGAKYAMLEVKRSEKAHHQPNQDFYVNQINDIGGFAAFIYPENEDEILEKMVEAIG